MKSERSDRRGTYSKFKNEFTLQKGKCLLRIMHLKLNRLYKLTEASHLNDSDTTQLVAQLTKLSSTPTEEQEKTPAHL